MAIGIRTKAYSIIWKDLVVNNRLGAHLSIALLRQAFKIGLADIMAPMVWRLKVDFMAITEAKVTPGASATIESHQNLPSRGCLPFLVLFTMDFAIAKKLLTSKD